MSDAVGAARAARRSAPTAGDRRRDRAARDPMGPERADGPRAQPGREVPAFAGEAAPSPSSSTQARRVPRRYLDPTNRGAEHDVPRAQPAGRCAGRTHDHCPAQEGVTRTTPKTREPRYRAVSEALCRTRTGDPFLTMAVRVSARWPTQSQNACTTAVRTSRKQRHRSASPGSLPWAVDRQRWTPFAGAIGQPWA